MGSRGIARTSVPERGGSVDEGMRCRRIRLVRPLAPLAALILAAACSSPAATPASSPAATSSAAASGGGPSSSASASPSPTPTISVTESPVPSTAQRIRAYAAMAGWRASATLTGTIGGTLGKVSGTYTGIDGDATLSLTITIAGKTQTTEQILIGDASYLRAPGQAWRRDLPEEGRVRAVSLPSALLAADFEDGASDTVTVKGRDAARIAEALCLVDPGLVPPNATAAITMSASGSLDKLVIGFDNGGRWEVTYQFAAAPNVAAIAAPKDAVVLDLHAKKILLFYPEGWTLKSLGEGGDVYDLFVSPTAEEVVVVYCIATKATLKSWTADGRTYYSKLLKAKVSATGAQTVNGVPWNITQWAKATSNVMDTPAFVVNAAAVRNGRGCDVQWHGPTSGDRASAALTQFVGTLQFLK